jgi:hypothetical protein
MIYAKVYLGIDLGIMNSADTSEINLSNSLDDRSPSSYAGFDTS